MRVNYNLDFIVLIFRTVRQTDDNQKRGGGEKNVEFPGKLISIYLRGNGSY